MDYRFESYELCHKEEIRFILYIFFVVHFYYFFPSFFSLATLFDSCRLEASLLVVVMVIKRNRSLASYFFAFFPLVPFTLSTVCRI